MIEIQVRNYNWLLFGSSGTFIVYIHRNILEECLLVRQGGVVCLYVCQNCYSTYITDRQKSRWWGRKLEKKVFDDVECNYQNRKGDGVLTTLITTLRYFFFLWLWLVLNTWKCFWVVVTLHRFNSLSWLMWESWNNSRSRCQEKSLRQSWLKTIPENCLTPSQSSTNPP